MKNKYRVKELNNVFTIEVWVEETPRKFLKKAVPGYWKRASITGGYSNFSGYMVVPAGPFVPCEHFDSLEKAKQRVKEWQNAQKEPVYHCID